MYPLLVLLRFRSNETGAVGAFNTKTSTRKTHSANCSVSLFAFRGSPSREINNGGSDAWKTSRYTARDPTRVCWRSRCVRLCLGLAFTSRSRDDDDNEHDDDDDDNYIFLYSPCARAGDHSEILRCGTFGPIGGRDEII